jgi:hypothetical protein
MPTGLSPAEPRPESLYAALTRWAAHARRRTLAGMLILGLAGAALILVLAGWHKVFFTGYPIALSSIGGWGLLQQRPGPHLDWVDDVQSLLVGLGMVAGIAAMIATLFVAMGPSPKL